MNVIFHVGLPKTGTTFLQNGVFPFLKNVNYKVYYDFKNIYNFKEDMINLISCESLSGNPIASIYLNAIRRDAIAYGLSSMFPDAKIIIGIRDKNSWLRSLYTQFVKEGGFISYNKWFYQLDKNYLNFEGYISLLKNLFSDVFVYNFENLVKNKKKGISEICDFIGVDVPNIDYNVVYNKSWNNGLLFIGRIRSLFFTGSRIVLEKVNYK